MTDKQRGHIELALIVIALGMTVFGLVLGAHCQTAILLPPPKIQFLDVNGKPLAGGFVFTYQAGTSISQSTFTDSTGSVSNTNPIVLDAGGFPSSPLGPGQAAGIYFISGASYRIVVQDKNGVQQYVADNVKLVSSSAVGGLNTQVQYNCGGLFCGNAGFTFNAGTQTLSVTALSVSSGGSLAGTFSGNPTFSGTVTVSGSLVVSGSFSLASLASSTCGSPASAGFIRLCRADAINWRNNANSADEGLSTDASDRLNVSHAGGLLLNGATPDIFFGGTSASFPRWHQAGTALQAKLADLSTDAPVTASTLTFNGAASGVTISGACSTGQVLTAASATSVTCATNPLVTIQSHNEQTTLSNTAVGNTGNVTIFSKSVTFPSAGGPWRALANWWVYASTTNSGQTYCAVFDDAGTPVGWAAQEHLSTQAESSFSITGSGTSPVTYANGSTHTFVMQCVANTAGGTVLSAAAQGTPPTLSNAPVSRLQLDVVSSN